MSDLLTMDEEEFLKRWHAYWEEYYRPKKVFMKDGVLIAGEDLKRGDLVYLQSSTSTTKMEVSE